MPKNAKVIKQRIGSVRNTRKITKSMQMIAAVKMQKTVKQANSSKQYATLAGNLLKSLGETQVEHPLLNKPEGRNTLLILVTASRGLCGSYDSNVLAKAQSYFENWKEQGEGELKILGIGKRSASFAKKRNLELVALYDKLSDNPVFSSVLPIAQTVLQGFLNGEFDQVDLIYTEFYNSFIQTPRKVELLPIEAEDLKRSVAEQELDVREYKFEPNALELLDYLLPRLVETQIYQSILESAASEHSSRMVAMKNATDNAGELIKALNLEFNKSRQSAITQEVAEIVGGIEAMGGLD